MLFFSSAAAGLVYVLIALLLFFVGTLQQFIVRYFVGLRGTKEDTLRDLWRIDRKLDSILAILTQKDLLSALDLSTGEELDEHTFLFRTPRLNKEQLFLVARRNTNAEETTELASVAYEIQGSDIGNTSTLRGITKMPMTYLKDQLTAKEVANMKKNFVK